MVCGRLGVETGGVLNVQYGCALRVWKGMNYRFMAVATTVVNRDNRENVEKIATDDTLHEKRC